MSNRPHRAPLIPYNENLNPITTSTGMIKDHSLNHQGAYGFRAFGKELTNLNHENINTSHLNANIDKKNNSLKLMINKPARSQSLNASQNNVDTQITKIENDSKVLKTLNDTLTQIPNYLEQTRIDDKDRLEDKLLSDNFNKNKDIEMELCDINDSNNPQGVSQYVKDIFKYLRETEGKCQPKSGYMAKQSDINEKMRAILVDWLVDVQAKFKLRQETLFLTVNILDRYLENSQIQKQKLQLAGVTAMLIASKYEEIYAPEVKDFVYVTDKTYNREEILEMEGKMLLILNFNLNCTTSNRFLERYAKLLGIDERTNMLAKYLIELALMDYKMLKYSASNIASSALYLACKVLKKEAWNDIMTRNTTYTEMQIRPCAKDLCVLLQNSNKSTLQAVRKKFSSPKYLEISKIQLDKQ